MPKFYVTAPIFYPNADLHLGHAYTTVLCDVLARSARLQGKETFFLTGNDDNATKVAQVAQALNLTPKEFVDEQAQKFATFYQQLDISADDFIQTSDQRRHWPGAIKLWRQLADAGDIEKRSYKGLYCVGCESFKTEKDLVDGLCPDHHTKPEEVEEENYFFKLSKYTHTIAKKIESDELKVIPETRKNEILSFLKQEAQDISFSRPTDKVLGWGIPVPGDSTQTMYVWCDALTNYISALGYGSEDEKLFETFWPADLHVVGKDISRFHAVIWPAMLLSAGLPLPKNILAHGFITSGGMKMSKTVGNVIDPLKVIADYGAEALRYFLVRHMNVGEDSDFTMDRFKEAYNAGLANGLGNVVSRVLTMAEKNNVSHVASVLNPERFNVDDFDLKKYVDKIWEEIQKIDKKIQDEEPYKIFKTDHEKAVGIVSELCTDLSVIAHLLSPIMPKTSKNILELLKNNKAPEEPLFPRID